MKFLLVVVNGGLYGKFTLGCFWRNYDYKGINMNGDGVSKDSATKCQSLCKATPGCNHFVFATRYYNGQHGKGVRKKCFLKNSGTLVPTNGLVTGPVSCAGDYKSISEQLRGDYLIDKDCV